MSSTATVHPTIGLLPDQVSALNGLVRETNAIAVDIAPADHRSLRVVTLHALDDGATEDDGKCEARWWTVSIAGTIREQGADPAQVAA